MVINSRSFYFFLIFLPVLLISFVLSFGIFNSQVKHHKEKYKKYYLEEADDLVTYLVTTEHSLKDAASAISYYDQKKLQINKLSIYLIETAIMWDCI